MKIDYMYCVCECFSFPLLKASQKNAILSITAAATVAVAAAAAVVVVAVVVVAAAAAAAVVLLIMKCFLYRQKCKHSR